MKEDQDVLGSSDYLEISKTQSDPNNKGTDEKDESCISTPTESPRPFKRLFTITKSPSKPKSPNDENTLPKNVNCPLIAPSAAFRPVAKRPVINPQSIASVAKGKYNSLSSLMGQKSVIGGIPVPKKLNADKV